MTNKTKPWSRSSMVSPSLIVPQAKAHGHRSATLAAVNVELSNRAHQEMQRINSFGGSKPSEARRLGASLAANQRPRIPAALLFGDAPDMLITVRGAGLDGDAALLREVVNM